MSPTGRSLATAESLLREKLASLHREYQRLCAPIVRELAGIESRKPPRPHFITADLSQIEVRVLAFMAKPDEA